VLFMGVALCGLLGAACESHDALVDPWPAEDGDREAAGDFDNGDGPPADRWDGGSPYAGGDSDNPALPADFDLPPFGEGCSDPISLPVGSGSVFGTTRIGGNTAEGSCGGFRRDGPDRTYVFTLAEPRWVSLKMLGYDTILHVRTECDDPTTEVVCNDAGEGPAALIDQVFEPGTYYLFADSWHEGGDYELVYDFRPDPCGGDPCPGEPECVADDRWTGGACRCPEGTLSHGERCLDDPCQPNPCAVPHQNTCTAEPPDGYACDCDLGYVDDGRGGCMLDPAGNAWGVMVYLNADNDLESDGYIDLLEMTAVGSTPNVHVVVLFDSAERDEGRSRKLYVQAGGVEILEEMGELDMADWRTLADFGVWVVNAFPAERWMLVLWDHGTGWKRRSADAEGVKGFSEDDHGEAQTISVAKGEYAQALAAITAELGRKLDVVGFDACVMGFWEVAAATAPYADLLVASQDNEPDEGWRYDLWLDPLAREPMMEPSDVARTIIDTYAGEGPRYPTLASIDLAQLDAVSAAIDALAERLIAHPEVFVAVETLRKASQLFANRDFQRDLADFAGRLADDETMPKDLRDAAATARDAVLAAVLYNQAVAAWPGAYGLSVYFPGRSAWTDSAYLDENAAWIAARWDDFLLDFTKGPMR